VYEIESEPEVGKTDDLRFRLGFMWFDPHRVIYATIILMTAYALFDEGTTPLTQRSYLEVIGVSIAPVFALAMAHAFSEALDLQIRFGRRLSGHDRRQLAKANLQYLYVAIPPMAIMAVLMIFQWNANDIITLVQVLGLASLFFWGSYAGKKAGLSPIRRLSFGFGYLLMGLFVITVELLITH